MSAEAQGRAPAAPLTASVLRMALFLASEVMFFGALFGAYFTIRARAETWPPPGSPDMDIALPLALTGVLLCSSVTQHLAVAALRRGDRAGLGRWLALTVALGLAFLAGEGTEWAGFISDGFTVSANVFGTLFFTITGFHGLHLIAGLAILLLALVKARARGPEAQRIGSLEAATYYWHFVDAVWIFVATSLYVLNL